MQECSARGASDGGDREVREVLHGLHDGRVMRALRLGLEGPHEPGCAITRHRTRQRVHFCDREAEKHCAALYRESCVADIGDAKRILSNGTHGLVAQGTSAASWGAGVLLFVALRARALTRSCGSGRPDVAQKCVNALRTALVFDEFGALATI